MYYPLNWTLLFFTNSKKLFVAYPAGNAAKNATEVVVSKISHVKL